MRASLARALEPEMEAFLSRLHPGLDREIHGATSEEIARMEELAGRPLPRFYRWFLERMGRSVGPLTYSTLDLSVTRILALDPKDVALEGRFLMIGYETDEVMPLHLFYDLDHPAREDFRVVSLDLLGGPINNRFETFREMLAWGELSANRVNAKPQRCEGLLELSGDLASALDPVMARLGFARPIPTGPCCSLFDRPDAAMAVSAAPDDPPRELRFFSLGGPDAGALRRILGAIATESDIAIDEIDSWTPPLP